MPDDDVDPTLDPDAWAFRNIMAIKEFTEQTRDLAREQNEKIAALEGIVMTNDGTIKNQQMQIAILQGKLLGGGPTSGNSG